MLIRSHLIDFASACSRITAENELHDLLVDATARLGFEKFALNHHVDLVRPPPDAVVLMNYDPAWIEQALVNGYHLDDPVHAASAKCAVGFAWQDIPRLIAMTPRQRTILDQAKRFGLSDGFTVPVHIPGEYRGTCSFGGRDVEIDLALAMTTQMVGLCAFEGARRLKVRNCGDPAAIPRLTQRQLDCLPLVASGKTDWAIGRILGVSPATAHQHVGEMMRRYAVASRTQLVVRALFDGQIVYNAALYG